MRDETGALGYRMAEGVVLFAAFLLFSLELAVAKALLPRFGGSPMVWTTSMLVYQVLLFAGYAYAHGLARRCTGAAQAWTHIGLLIVAFAFAACRLRVSVLASGDPGSVSRSPMAGLLWTMLATVGIPFIAISATSPLIQYWQQRLSPERSTYRLYAVSNVGSFAALLAYPFLIEPWLSLERQFAVWTVLFGLTAIALAATALRVRKTGGQGGGQSSRRSQTGGHEGEPSAGRKKLWLWVLLPAGTSALLLSATNELCQDLAVFPFLWVLPLSLYLLSFSLTFRTRPMGGLLPWAAGATVVALGTTSMSLMLPAPIHVLSISALVCALCLAAHRELYRIRPPVEHLTAYYLWIAAGSGLGAAVVTLLAPACFTGYWEFQISIAVVWVGLILGTLSDPEGSLRIGDRKQAAVLLGIVTCMAVNRVPESWLDASVPGWSSSWTAPLRIGAAVAITAALWFCAFRKRRASGSVIWPRVLAGLVLFLVECSLIERVRADRSPTGVVARNFFGVVRVQELVHQTAGIGVRQLNHGRINHGWQYLNPGLTGEPTAYHSPSTGIGRMIRSLQGKRASIKIGVTGLGVGALAGYPRAADTIVFYEIDPQVVALAAGPDATFTFLGDCTGRTEIVVGDARQSMQKELAAGVPRQYDVLALDAFSSDAIPMHLLTREAIGLYLAHLVQPSGVLAVNISNRFLDIEPVLSQAAMTHGLHAVLVDSNGDRPVRARSLWVLMSRDAAVLEDDLIAEVSRGLTDERVAWTDTYGSPFQLIKWWSPDSRRFRLVSPRRDKGEEITAPELAPSQKAVGQEARDR